MRGSILALSALFGIACTVASAQPVPAPPVPAPPGPPQPGPPQPGPAQPGLLQAPPPLAQAPSNEAPPTVRELALLALIQQLHQREINLFLRAFAAESQALALRERLARSNEPAPVPRP